jgi:hypothetical protein
VLVTPVQKVQKKDTLPANAGAGVAKTTRKKTAVKEKKPRPRNLLFDAIQTATGADREVDGSHIGKFAAMFAKATPPIAPEEVRDFASNWRSAFPWADAERQPLLTVGILGKHMTEFRVWRGRHAPPAPTAPTGPVDWGRQPRKGEV